MTEQKPRKHIEPIYDDEYFKSLDATTTTGINVDVELVTKEAYDKLQEEYLGLKEASTRHLSLENQMKEAYSNLQSQLTRAQELLDVARNALSDAEATLRLNGLPYHATREALAKIGAKSNE